MTGLIRTSVVWMALWWVNPLSAEESSQADASAEARAHARELLEQLAHPSFPVRDAASSELVHLGRDAIDALEAGLAHPEADVRETCRRLLPMAVETDLLSRIQAFLADPEGIQDYGLPGWDRFRESMGTEQAARELYARMLQADSTLLETTGLDRQLLSERYVGRVTELQQVFNQANRIKGATGSFLPEEVATLLFVGLDPRLPRNDPALSALGNMFYQPAFRAAVLSGDEDGRMIRQLFFEWVEARKDCSASYQAFYLIANTDMKEALPLALKITKDDQAYSQSRGMALLVVGKYGDESNVADLEPLIENETVLTNFQINNIRGQAQVRDVALAMCVYLTGQKLEDYPFDVLQGRPLNFSYYYNLGFSDDTSRNAALTQWKEWRAEHPSE